MTNEFAIIDQFFRRPSSRATLGVGDDAAIFSLPAGQSTVISCDALVENVHFFSDVNAADLGWKVLAVNISDMAAMAATPRFALLSLTLPNNDERWLEDFSAGFFACAEAFGVELIGGDTCRGPLNIAVTIIGAVDNGKACQRGGARAGDDLWISGNPGLAALGLSVLRSQRALPEAVSEQAVQALLRPQPRVSLGLALGALASAMMDVSDGLGGDLMQILRASQLGARLEEDLLPINTLLAAGLTTDEARTLLLQGGDDYELLFTAAPEQRQILLTLGERLAVPLHRIGSLATGAAHIMITSNNGERSYNAASFNHFN